MVTYLAALILLFTLGATQSFGGEPRQQCLNCHGGHYPEHGRCGSCHGGNPAAGRKNIAHHGLIAGRFARFALKDDAVVREGQRLLERFSCRRCHVTAGRGNRLATSLDALRHRKTPEELAASIRKPVLGMPDFGVTGRQAEMLVNAILAGAQGVKKTDARPPDKVHFDVGNGKNKDLFSRKCGACHRALTVRYGVAGQGNAGPNLSGLLSRWYPKTFKNGEEWNRARLEKWLQNPRAVRKNATMQPQELSNAELTELSELLGGDL